MMTDPPKSSVTVRIAGEDHTIRANAPPEHTERCARLVDERIEGIKKRLGRMEDQKAAILAALSISDEYFGALRELARVREDMSKDLATLTKRLRRELKK